MNLLFICTGNTCRSLMAEGYARKLIKTRGLSGVEASSCGTYASPGYPVPKIVLKLMENEGVDVSGHVSTLLTKGLVEKADLVLVMEKTHLADTVSLFPSAKNKTHLLKRYAGCAGAGNGDEIQDPIGRSDQFYRDCLEEIRQCLEKVFMKLFNERTGC